MWGVIFRVNEKLVAFYSFHLLSSCSAQQAASTAHSYAPTYRTHQQQQQQQQQEERRDAPYAFSHDRSVLAAQDAGDDAADEDAEGFFEMDI